MVLGLFTALVFRLVVVLLVLVVLAYLLIRYTRLVSSLLKWLDINVSGNVKSASAVDNFSVALSKGPLRCITVRSIQLGSPLSFGLVFRVLLGGANPVPLSIKGVRVVLRAPAAPWPPLSTCAASTSGGQHSKKGGLPAAIVALLLRLVFKVISAFKLKLSSLVLELQADTHQLKASFTEFSLRCTAPSGSKSKAAVELVDLQLALYQGKTVEGHDTPRSSGTAGGDVQLLGTCSHMGCSAIMDLDKLAVLDAKLSVAPIRVALTQDLVISCLQEAKGTAHKEQAAPTAPSHPPDVSALFAHCAEKVSVRLGSIAVRLHPGQKLPEASVQLDAALQQLELNVSKPSVPTSGSGSTSANTTTITVDASWGPLLLSVLPVRPASPSYQEQSFLPFVSAPTDPSQSVTGGHQLPPLGSQRAAEPRRAAELKLGITRVQGTLQCTHVLPVPARSGILSRTASFSRAASFSRPASFSRTASLRRSGSIASPKAKPGLSPVLSGGVDTSVSSLPDVPLVNAKLEDAVKIAEAATPRDSSVTKHPAAKELRLQVDLGMDVANASCSLYVPMLTQLLDMATEALPSLHNMLAVVPPTDVPGHRRTISGHIRRPSHSRRTASQSFDAGSGLDLGLDIAGVSATGMQLPNRAFRLTHEMEEFELEVEPRPFTPGLAAPITPAVYDKSERKVGSPAVVLEVRFAARATLTENVQVLLSNEVGEAAWQLQLGRMDVASTGAVHSLQGWGQGKGSRAPVVQETRREDVTVTGKVDKVTLHVWHARPEFGVPLRPESALSGTCTRLLHVSHVAGTVSIPCAPTPTADATKSEAHALTPDPFIPLSITSQVGSLSVSLNGQALTRSMGGLFPIVSCACSSMLHIQRRMQPRQTRTPDLTNPWIKRQSESTPDATPTPNHPPSPKPKLSHLQLAVSGGIELSYTADIEYSGTHVAHDAAIPASATTFVRLGRVDMLVQPLTDSMKLQLQSFQVVLVETATDVLSETQALSRFLRRSSDDAYRASFNAPNLGGKDNDVTHVGVEGLRQSRDTRSLSEELAAALSSVDASGPDSSADTLVDKSIAAPTLYFNPVANLDGDRVNHRASNGPDLGGREGTNLRESQLHSDYFPTPLGAAATPVGVSMGAGSEGLRYQPPFEVVVLNLMQVQCLVSVPEDVSSAGASVKVHGKKLVACVDVDVLLCWLRVAEEAALLASRVKQRTMDLAGMIGDAAGELGYSGGSSLPTPFEQGPTTTNAGSGPVPHIEVMLDALNAQVKIGVRDELQVILRGIQAAALSKQVTIEALRIAQNGATLARARELTLSLLDPTVPHTQEPPVDLGASISSTTSSASTHHSTGSVSSPTTGLLWTQLHSLKSQASMRKTDDDRQMLLRRQAARRRVGANLWEPLLPDILSLKIAAQQVVAKVPHDRWPGRLYFYAELWVEAVMEVVRPYVDAIKQALGSPAGSGGNRQREDFVELVFDINKVAFSLEAHPLEHWFALHGPALASIAGRRQLQERMLEQQYNEMKFATRCHSPSLERTTTTEASVAAGSSNRSMADGSDTTFEEDLIEEYAAAKDPNWYQSMEDLFQLYRTKVAAIQTARSSELHHNGALMHVLADNAQAVIMISNDKLERVQQTALATVLRVDPVSNGVRFSKLDPLSIDASVNNLVAHFSGAEPSTARIGRLHANGSLVRARQLAARPTTFAQTYPVGRYHCATLHQPVKGSRPPAKSYTDFSVQMDDMYGVGTMGLMSSFAQLAVGFKRLIPPDFIESDGGASDMDKDSNAWWDTMRYQWRGNLMVRIRNMNAVVGKVTSPVVTEHDERIVMQAATFNVGISAGRIDVVTTDITCSAFAHMPLLGLGEPMLRIPYMDLPLLNFSISGTWDMPEGRHWMQHHIFPMWEHDPPPDAVQEPLDTARLIEGLGWTMAMEISLSPDSSSKPRPAAVGPTSPSPALNLPPHMRKLFWADVSMRQSPIPRVYIGEFQWVFLMDFVDLLSNAPVWIDNAAAIKSYFSPRSGSKGGKKETPLPQLQRRIDVNLTASIIDLWHDAQDPEDPSDNTYLRGRSLRYQNSFTYYHVAQMVKLSNGSKTRMQQMRNMVGLSVEMYDLKVVRGMDELLHELQILRDEGLKMTAEGGRVLPPTPEQDPKSQEYPEPQFENGLILSINMLLLRQASTAPVTASIASRPDEPLEGPIRIIVQDVRILCPKELRDTCIALYMHINSALSVEVELLKPQRVDASMYETLGDVRGDKGLTSPRDPNRPSSPLLRSGQILSPGRGSPPSATSRRAESVMAMNRARRTESVFQQALQLKEQAVRDEAMRMEDELLQAILQQNKATAVAHKGIIPAAVDVGSNRDDGSEVSEAILEEPDEFDNMDILLQTLKPDPDEPHHMSQTLVTKNKGILEYEIEFVHIQVNLVCPEGSGSLLLGANSALLKGHRYPEVNERTLTFSMDQVQAHMLFMDPSCQESPANTWLKIVNGHLQPETKNTALQKNVLRPFKVHLCQSEVIQNNGQDRSSHGSPPSPKKKHSSQDRATRELTITVPEIDAELDSLEFDMLMDIIQTMFIAPLPKIDLLTDYDIPFEEGVDDQAPVIHLHTQLEVLKMHKRCLQQERLVLQLGGERSGELESPSVWRHLAMPDSPDTNSPVQPYTSDFDYNSRGPLTRSNQFRPLHSQSSLPSHTSTAAMLTWITSQVTRYQMAVAENLENWKLMRADMAKMLLRPRVSSRTLVSVNRIRWILTRNKIAFVEASLKDISFNSTREQDYSGNTKVQLRSILLQDLQGNMGPAPGMQPGVILMPWKPDATWEDDEMMRMFVINGPVDNGKIVYEHLEVLVHPVMVHMTMNLGVGLSDYFTRDPSSLPTPLPTTPVDDTGSKSSSRSTTPPPNLQLQALRASTGAHPVTPKKSPAPPPTAAGGWWGGSRMARQTSSLDEVDTPATGELIRAVPGGFEESSGMFHHTPSVISHTAKASSMDSTATTRYGMALRQKRLYMQQYTRNQCLPPAMTKTIIGASTTTVAHLPDSSHTSTPGRTRLAAHSTDRTREEPSHMHKRTPVSRYRFKHVRFNNFYSRVTFEGQVLGAPISLTDWTLVLDTGVFRNIDVSWKELLERYKKDVLISSLVKSISGLQTKKINILKDHPDSEEHMLKKAAAGLKGKINKINIFKKDKSKKNMLKGESSQAAAISDGGLETQGSTGAASDSTDGGQPGGSKEKVKLVPEADKLVREHVKAKKLQHLLGQVPPMPVTNYW